MGWTGRHRTGIGRRGVELSTALVVLVIFGVVFIVLIMLYKQFLTLGKTEFTTKECQSSLLMTKAVSSAVKNFCFVGTPDVVPLQCSRSFISVSPTKAVKDENTVTSQYDATCPAGGNFGTTGCLQQNVVANAMAQCWSTFFNGEQIALQQVDIEAYKLWKTKDRKQACFICSEIVLKDSQMSGFTLYLKNAQYKQGITYYDYLAKNSKAWCDHNLAEKVLENTCWDATRAGADTALFGITHPRNPLPTDNFALGSKYVIAFVRRGLGSCDNEKSQDTSVTGQYLTNTVQLIPVSQLSNECDVVVT